MAIGDTLGRLWNRLSGKRPKEKTPYEESAYEPGDVGGWHMPSSTAIAKMMWERYHAHSDRREDYGIVYLVFRSGKGKSYGYPEVPWSVWNEGLKSSSKGKWHHQVLQPGYSVGVIGRTKHPGKGVK